VQPVSAALHLELHQPDAEFEQHWLAKPNKPAHSPGYGVRNSMARSVKVNYGKFGDLLAEVKAVTGEAA